MTSSFRRGRKPRSRHYAAQGREGRARGQIRTWGIAGLVAGLAAIIGLIVFMVLLIPARLTRSRRAAERDADMAAGRNIAPGEADHPGRIDEGNLIHQLAETLGVEETAVLLPRNRSGAFRIAGARRSGRGCCRGSCADREGRSRAGQEFAGGRGEQCAGREQSLTRIAGEGLAPQL